MFRFIQFILTKEKKGMEEKWISLIWKSKQYSYILFVSQSISHFPTAVFLNLSNFKKSGLYLPEFPSQNADKGILGNEVYIVAEVEKHCPTASLNFR